MRTDRPPAPTSRSSRVLASPLRWLVPAALLVAWLVVGSIGGPYSGKLSEVQKNDASSFLPASAESTKVSDLQKTFTDQQTFPAFVLLEADRALTPQQLAALQAFTRTIPDVEIPVAGHPPVHVRDFLVPGSVPVIPSQDGRAALALVNFAATDLGHTLPDGKSPLQRAVEQIRAADGSLATDGARVYVAGPAGLIADLVKAFSGIDGILLLVAVVTVLVILLIVYRSPIVPFFVLFAAGFALTLASVVVYVLASNDVITLDGQGQGILSILVIGAATDYALLLVARYREELRRHDDRYEAMWLAWRRALEPILASGTTVIIGLLCLLFSNLGPTRGLGPVGAIGIASAMASALTFLPAILLLPGRQRAGEHGRWIFWPAVPHVGSVGPETTGIWARVSQFVGRRPRRSAIVSGVVLLALASFLPTFSARGVSTSDTFLTTVESVTGGDALSRHFPGGSGNPTVVIGPAADVDRLVAAIRSTPGVASVVPVTGAAAAATPGAPAAAPRVVDGRVELEVTLADKADTPAADESVRRLRAGLDGISRDALVGGVTASNLDVRDISAHDRNLIIPIILVVIFIVLAVLLRALVAPLILLVANVLSFAATVGASALVFNHVFGFPGADPSIPLYGFVFLVALGIDYSIFLMTRVREESQRQGTRPGILAGLAVTGGVITSAGIVLAATFAALGVLIDTFLVRSFLVPSVAYLLGRRTWLPGRLGRADGPAAGADEAPAADRAPAAG